MLTHLKMVINSNITNTDVSSDAKVSGGSTFKVGYTAIGNDGLFLANVCNQINFNNAQSASVDGKIFNP